jgi:four helix bundle protein
LQVKGGKLMSAKKFEDLEIWKDARFLVGEIYKITSKIKFSKDYGLKDQIQRAAVSIMNNIAEDFEREGNVEFIRFLSISKGSAGEVRSLLYVAKDLGYINDEEFQLLFNSSVQLIKRISKLISYLRKNKSIRL